jgi:glycosyltransferase involved in cell wall biosynthesis
VQAFEIIVVNDGSTDKSVQAVMEIKDERIRLMGQPNKGVSTARNNGIRQAGCELVAFLDADDAWKPDFLETIMRLRQLYPEAGLYAAAYETSNVEAPAVKVKYRGIPPEPWEGIIPDFFYSMLGQPPVWTSAAVVPRHVFEASGYFREGEVLAEDVDMWCRVALKFPIAYSTRISATYFQDAENRCYVRGSIHKKATGYLETLNAAKNDKSLPDGTRKSISILKEMVEIGHASSLILGHAAADARSELRSFKPEHLQKQKTFWFLLSFLPVKLIELLLDLKAFIRKAKR